MIVIDKGIANKILIFHSIMKYSLNNANSISEKSTAHSID